MNISESGAIEHTIQNHVAIVTMNNPPANTWTADSLTELKQLVLALNDNKDVYALVLTGQGEKFFSAGADLKLFASGDKAVAVDMSRLFGAAFEARFQTEGCGV